jgi:hypothetical protein
VFFSHNKSVNSIFLADLSAQLNGANTVASEQASVAAAKLYFSMLFCTDNITKSDIKMLPGARVASAEAGDMMAKATEKHWRSREVPWKAYLQREAAQTEKSEARLVNGRHLMRKELTCTSPDKEFTMTRWQYGRWRSLPDKPSLPTELISGKCKWQEK